MTISKALAVFKSINKLSEQSFPFQTARALKKIRDALKSEMELFGEEERKLAVSCGGAIDGGRVDFPETASQAAYVAKINDILAQEADVVLDPVKLSPAALNLSMNDLDALEGVIEFTEG